MKDTLGAGRQIIPVPSPSGTATFVRCRSCGFVFPLSLACFRSSKLPSAEKRLIAIAADILFVSRSVPVFHAPSEVAGLGTQRVEEESNAFLFLKARVASLGQRCVTRRHAHEELLKTFVTARQTCSFGNPDDS